MKEYSDNEIIECLRNRQSYVVSYLSKRYMPMIRFMVYRKGGSNEDAKDLFQEGLMIILERIDDRSFALTCKFRTFLYCICENLWKALREKREVEANYLSQTTGTEDDTDFTESLDRKLYKSIFLKAFDSLDESGRKVLKLYWQEKSPREIADTLGFTYGYVRKKKSVAQAELVERVKKHPDYKRIMGAEG